MSTAIVQTKALRKTFTELKNFFVKGSYTLAVHFETVDDKLYISTGSNCLYRKGLEMKESIANTSATVTVIDLQYCLGDSDLTTLEFLPTGIRLENENAALMLNNAYSTVPKLPNLDDVSYFDINTEHICAGLKTLTNVRLSALYKKESPIHIYQNVAVLKYPNVWIATQTIGFQLSTILSAEHCKLMEIIEPTRIGMYSTDYLVAANDSTLLMLPCKEVNDSYEIPNMIADMSGPYRQEWTQYLGQLSALEKTKVPFVSIGLYEHGINTSAQKDGLDMNFRCGVTTGKLLTSFTVPLQLWFTCLKAINTELLEILYKEDTVCLRTTSVIIVLRVLP